MYWTLVDNFEWNFAWELRFGLYEWHPDMGMERKFRSNAKVRSPHLEHPVSWPAVDHFGFEISLLRATFPTNESCPPLILEKAMAACGCANLGHRLQDHRFLTWSSSGFRFELQGRSTDQSQSRHQCLQEKWSVVTVRRLVAVVFLCLESKGECRRG